MKMTRRQIVGRIPKERSRRVRRKVSLNALLIEALTNVTTEDKRGA